MNTRTYSDPKHLIEKMYGKVRWTTPVSGFIRCPGWYCHTTKNHERDCMIFFDSVPTIFCLHKSCSHIIARENKRLRDALRYNCCLFVNNYPILKGPFVYDENINAAVIHSPESEEKRKLRNCSLLARRVFGNVLDIFRWNLEQIKYDSPVEIPEDSSQQFCLFMRLFDRNDVVWHGDLYDSGKPWHRVMFRKSAEWQNLGGPIANFVSVAVYRDGSYSRSANNIERIDYFVVESDILDKEKFAAIINFLRKRLGLRLRAIVDTAGKSLHAWFERTSNMEEIKSMLDAWYCDTSMMRHSQIARVPGCPRKTKIQKLLWIDPK